MKSLRAAVSDTSNWPILGILLLAALMRFWRIGADGMWTDELSSVVFSTRGLFGAVRTAALDTGPPLYYVLQTIVNSVFGVGEAGMRAISAFAGVGSAGVAYLIGNKLYGRTVALLAASMTAIGSVMIQYGREARAYSLAVLLAACVAYTLLRVLERGTGWDYALHALAIIAACYTHLFGLIAAAGIVAGVLVRPRLVRALGWRWAAALAASVVAFLPWLVILLRQAMRVAEQEAAGQWVLSPPGDIFEVFWDTLIRYTPWAGGNPVMHAAFAGLLLFGAFAAVVFVERGSLTPERPVRLDGVDRSALLVGWIAMVYLGGLLVSKYVVPIFDYRMAVVAAPALYLLAARGLVQLWRPVAVVLVVATLAYAVHGVTTLYTTPKKQQWREATEYLLEREAEEDGIIAYTSFIMTNVDTYARILGHADGLTGHRVSRAFSDEELDEQLDEILADKDSVYLLQGHVPKLDGSLTALDLAMQRQGWVMEDSLELIGVWLHHYVRPPGDAASVSQGDGP